MCGCNNYEENPAKVLAFEVLASTNGAIVVTAGGDNHRLSKAHARTAVFTDPKAFGEWCQAWFQANVPAEAKP